ncbi:MAG: hypothetical protein CSA20_09700 [Deltaproteobacteria bacterium]|nr:MAG: hypothetical protein CSA20_09700 [Deltaproteobacteria bacterium]
MYLQKKWPSVLFFIVRFVTLSALSPALFETKLTAHGFGITVSQGFFTCCNPETTWSGSCWPKKHLVFKSEKGTLFVQTQSAISS